LNKAADQKSPYFHWAKYTLNKTPPIFQSAPITKLSP